MRVLYFPNLPQNPYQRLFYQALQAHDIHAQPLPVINDADLRQRSVSPEKPDWIHLHWLEGLIGEGSTFTRLRRIVSLYRYLRTARRLGVRIAWTVHNHQRHDGFKRIDRLGQRVVARTCDLILTHSQWSATWVQDRFHPRAKIVVMPHGNYDGVYPPGSHTSSAREEVLRTLHLDSALPVVGVIGAVRPYRGHEHAIDAVGQLSGRVQLLIAGWEFNPVYSAALRQRVSCLAPAGRRGEAPTVAFHLAGIPDEEYACLVRACDVVLLPYHNITSSGAILAAWTLGRPVVTSDLPFFRELAQACAQAGCGAALYPCVVEDPRKLAQAITQALAQPVAERQRAARTMAERYAWENVVSPVAQALRSGVG